MPKRDRYRSRLFLRDVTKVTGSIKQFRTGDIPMAQQAVWNQSSHSLGHGPKHRIYTFPLTLGAVTGTAYWTPQFDGQMLSVRLSITSSDLPSNASGTVFDLLLNNTSVFNGAGEYPIITSGTQHSPVAIVTRGVWVSGDNWVMQCISTGGSTGTVTASFEYLGGGE